MILWNAKQKRAYHRIKSGVRVARLKHRRIKHLILTTSPDGSSRNICSDFQVLRKRVLRNFNFLMPYCMVHTNEGYGVLHVLYAGKYLPQAWLSAQWGDIHKSPYVYIKEPPNDVAGYVTTQYVANQDTSFQRCSWSHNWVCRGFVKKWKFLCRWAREWHKSLSELLVKWDDFLLSVSFVQSLLPIGDPPP